MGCCVSSLESHHQTLQIASPDQISMHSCIWYGHLAVWILLRHTCWSVFLGVIGCGGVQLILAYSWARLAILVAGKGRGECFYFFCFYSPFVFFFPFIAVPLSSLSLSFISSTISSISLSLRDDTKWPTVVDMPFPAKMSPCAYMYVNVDQTVSSSLVQNSVHAVQRHGILKYVDPKCPAYAQTDPICNILVGYFLRAGTLYWSNMMHCEHCDNYVVSPGSQ